MALQGHVKTISLIEIFQFLSANKHTGTLTIRSRAQTRTVYLVGGSIHVPRLQAFTVGRIGDFLVKQGRIGVDRVYSALEEQRNTGKRLGEILVERGDLTEDELEQVLRSQYEEEIYQVFIWDDATFRFEKDVVPDETRDECENIVLQAENLCMEAARRTDEWERLIAAIPSLRAIYCIREGAQPEIEQIAAARKVNFDVSLINGQRSVQDLFNAAREGQFQVAEFLFACIEASLIEPLDGTSIPDYFRQALKSGSFEYAISLVMHGQASPDCDSSVVRELEATLFKTRAFIRAEDRMSIPVNRAGPAFVEFLLTVVKSMMTGVIIARTGSSETAICIDRQQVRLTSRDRDLLQLEQYLGSDTRISPIDVKKLTQQAGHAGAPGGVGVNASIIGSGVVDPRSWHDHLLGVFFREVYQLALSLGVEATFEKNLSGGDFELSSHDVVLDIHQENTFFELTEGLGQWLERAEVLSILDMVLIETNFEPIDSEALGYVNGKSSVRDILERSRVDPVETYNALVDLVDTGHARPLDVAEMMDAVQYMLGADLTADALKLCRAAQRCDLDAETFAEVESAIIEEHGDVTTADKEYLLSGDAGDFSLAEVLQSLHNHGKSGTLKITDGTSEREIHFARGGVNYLRTEDAEKSSFGNQFLDEFDLQDMTEGLFGDEAIPTGEVSEDEVSEALCQQIKEEIYDTFIWDNASFVFTANYFPAEYLAPSPTTTKLKLSTDRFMMQAISIIQDWEAIQRAFSMRTIFKFVSSEAKMEAVKDMGKPEVLYLIDGRLPVSSVVRRSGFDKLRVCKLLFELLEAGWIEALQVDDLLLAATAAIEKGDDPGSLTYLYYALELDPSNDEVRDAIEQISGEAPD